MNFNLNVAKALLGAAVVVGATTAISQPASALSFSFTQNQTTSNLGGVTTVGFTSGVGSLPAGYTENGITYTGGGIIANGASLANQYAAPPGVTTNYLSLGGDGQPSPVTIALGSLKRYFGLYVGSIDSYNSFTFFNGSDQVGSSLNGNQLAALVGLPANGNQGINGAGYAEFSDNIGFDKIVLASSRAALESDNHAFSTNVPTPALLPGLIGMGVAALRKRKNEAAEQADA